MKTSPLRITHGHIFQKRFSLESKKLFSMRHRVRNVVLFALVSCAGFSQVQTEKEIALGQRLSADMDSRQNVITDPEVTVFINEVLKTLSGGEALRLPLKVKVVDSAELFASALPGGYLVLSSGAILGANNEAELAGLLAHAMGHVQSGQSFKQSGSTGVKQSGPTGIPLIFIGGPWGSCFRDHASLLPFSTLAQADIFEIQADMLGLGYLMNAGYDPQSLVTVFERWKGKFGPNEQVGAKALALGRAAGDTVLNKSRFEQFKARLTRRPDRAPMIL